MQSIMPAARRRSRQTREKPVICLSKPQVETFGPTALTLTRRRSLLRKIMSSEGVCLCNQRPFINFETSYIKELLTGKKGNKDERATDAIVVWQPVRVNGKSDKKDRVVVGFALLTASDGVAKLNAICSCRTFNVTANLFKRVLARAKEYKADRLDIDSLPHVCYYYSVKHGFRFNDPALEKAMAQFAVWAARLAPDLKRRLVQYLSNLSTTSSASSSSCLQGLLNLRSKKDRLYRGKTLLVNFLRRAVEPHGLRRNAAYLDLVDVLSRHGVPMFLSLRPPKSSATSARETAAPSVSDRPRRSASRPRY